MHPEITSRLDKAVVAIDTYLQKHEHERTLRAKKLRQDLAVRHVRLSNGTVIRVAPLPWPENMPWPGWDEKEGGE